MQDLKTRSKDTGLILDGEICRWHIVSLPYRCASWCSLVTLPQDGTKYTRSWFLFCTSPTISTWTCNISSARIQTIERWFSIKGFPFENDTGSDGNHVGRECLYANSINWGLRNQTIIVVPVHLVNLAGEQPQRMAKSTAFGLGSSQATRFSQ
jgi:hypothetical protein